MNERIRLLAKQATLKWAEEVPGGVQEMEFFDKEKFAELIVAECAKLANEETSLPYDSYSEKIKKHFGVKE